jgi:hypothetical protein
MALSVAGRDDVDIAAEQGRVCALATDCLRDLQDCASEYPGLFSAKPFGPTVFSGVALANAFGSPGATADGIRIAARMALWAFALDWLVDYTATSRTEIEAIVAGCEAVGDGAPPDPDVPLQGLLASLRDDLAGRPGWAGLSPVWREHLRMYLHANALEWDWKTAHTAGDRTALPTFEEYLANADNFGSSLVNVSHWIWGGAVATEAELGELAAVSAEVQRTLRLLNDLATYERDVAWGDLNSLMLGLGRDDVTKRIGELVESCEKMTEPLATRFPGEAVYLRRQIGYSVGYYGMTDYWGTL